MGRFTYSKWDGTQVGFEFDADDIFSELTDELLYHGDLNQALQRLMQRGFQDRNDERVAGMREILEKLRQRRREMLERHDLGGPYEDIAQRLRDIVQQERTGIDQLAQDARDSGDARRQEITDEVAAERRMALDLLPPDLAGQVQSLQEYEWTSSEARQELRAAARRSAVAAHAELFQPDVERHVGHVAGVDAAHQGHVQRPQPHARDAR